MPRPSPRRPIRLTAAIGLLISSGTAGAQAPPPAVSTRPGPADALLNQWHAEGTCAGNQGTYYDNRDGAHSDIPVQHYPGLQRITYGEEEKKTKAHLGMAGRLLPQVTIGNSSMATPATQQGSLPRIYYTHPQGLHFLFNQYLNNNLYVYPEHRDHDPGINGAGGYGDLLPTNTPYLLISQGSSLSDRPFILALIKTLAAFRPEVREKLVTRRLVAPTLQQLLRSNYGPEEAPFDYLSGQAHPTAFDSKYLNELAMVKAAHDMAADTIPPLIHLQLIKEDKATPGIDYFEAKELQSLAIADTNANIARVFRASRSQHQMVVSARQSIDINNRRLTYRWAVLRGDPRRVKIVPSDDGGTAEITVAYHSRRPVHEGSPIQSNRVDIGVFAHNGHHYSAPGLITILTLANESRIYSREGHLLEIHYQARPHQYTLANPSPESWMPGLQSFSPNAPPELHQLMPKATDEKGFSELRQAHHDNLEAYKQIDLFRKKAKQRTTELDARVKEAESGLQNLQKTVGDSQAPNPELLEAQQTLALAEATRRDAQPEIDALIQRSETLSQDITSYLTRHAPTLQPHIHSLVQTVQNDPTYYLRHRLSIDSLAKKDKAASASINSKLDELVSLRVLSRNGQHLSLASGSSKVTPNDFHHLRQLNLLIVQHLLLPEIIQHNTSQNYVDPRLTSKKPWRDIYHYDQDGQRTGWTRIRQGQTTSFDSQGRQLPTTPGAPPIKVFYTRDPKSGQLTWSPR